MRTKKSNGKPNTMQVTVNKKLAKELKMLSSVSMLRSRLAQGLGQSYNGQRDLYQALGYKKELTYRDYYDKYNRQDIAKRVVNAYPEATWRTNPQVIEDDGDDNITTSFELDWTSLVENLSIYHYLARVDKLAGIGQYAILYLGYSDSDDVSKEVTPSSSLKLLYMTPYSEENACINTLNSDKTSERYGMPETYRLRTKNLNTAKGTSTTSTTDIIVHYSRIIHVAEGLLESNTLGTPRLKCVYNRLENLALIVGGSSEMFWRGGFPGYSFEMDPDADLDPQDVKELDNQIDEYMHSMRRYIKLQGIKTNSLSAQIADPEKHIDVQLKLISGATGIPVRLLTGSERGELSSSQDKENWNDRVSERRTDFAELVILRPLINNLIKYGIISEPSNGYIIKWTDMNALSEKEQADINKTRSDGLAAYVKSGASEIIPPFKYLTDFQGMSEEQASSILGAMVDMLNQERRDIIEMQATNDQESTV